MGKINVNSTFSLKERIESADNTVFNPLTHDWELSYMTSGWKRYIVSCHDGVLSENVRVDETTGDIYVQFVKHGLPVGVLYKTLSTWDADGIIHEETPAVTDIELWDGPTDYDFAEQSAFIYEVMRGPAGLSPTVNVGKTTTIEAGLPAAVRNNGTEQDAVFEFDIPRGDSATIDSVFAETLPAGSLASVQNVGDKNHASFVFGIPKGDKGAAGIDGSDGADGLDGKSAFETAVEGGYVGTESEFTEQLAATPIVQSVDGTDVSLAVVGARIYLCGTLTSLTLQSVEDSPRESVIRFKSGSTPTTLTLPATLEVVGWTVPQANHSYEISIANNRAIIAYFETL